MNIFKKITVSVSGMMALVIYAIGLTSPASAFSVTPMKQLISLTPGQEYTGEVTAFSPLDNTETTKYEAKIVPITVDDNNANYSIVTTEMTSITDIVNWTTLSSNDGEMNRNGVITGTFGPGESVNFDYTIKVPENAKGGGQYFAVEIVSTSNPDGNSQDTSVGIAERIAIYSIVCAEVAGDSNAIGAIQENSTSAFVLEPKITTSFVAKNEGNTHLRAVSYLQIFPIFSSEEIYSNEEEPVLTDVLPGTTRYVTEQWNDAPLVGIFKVKQTAYFENSPNEKSIMEKTVIICPIWLLFLIIFVVVGLIVFIILKAKNRSKKGSRAKASE